MSFCFFVFLFYYYYFLIYFWLCWVSIAVRRLSLVAVSRGYSSSRCAGLSLSWPLLLRSTDSRCAGSVVVAHGSSCSTACGIFPDQGSNPCPLHRQADSQPLHHQGSPGRWILNHCATRETHGCILFVFISITLGDGSKEILLSFMSKSVLPMFSSKSFREIGRASCRERVSSPV